MACIQPAALVPSNPCSKIALHVVHSLDFVAHLHAQAPGTAAGGAGASGDGSTNQAVRLLPLLAFCKTNLRPT